MPVRGARQRHHAVGEDVEQQPGEGEVAEEVGADLHLEAVGGALLGDGHEAGVVDQHVDGAVELGGERAHRGQVGEVEPADVGAARGPVADRGGGLGALVGVAHGQDDVGAGADELAGGLEADPRVRAGDHERPSGLVADVVGGPRSHGGTVPRGTPEPNGGQSRARTSARWR